LKEPVRNLILAIGDGMGEAQVKAGGQPFPKFPYQGFVTTCSLSGITDSAASATTMATGEKTLNGRIGLSAKGEALPTILELAAASGRATGLLTTTEITHGTPAPFAAHQMSRESADAIAQEYLTQSRPNLLLGGGKKFFPEALLAHSGYQVVENFRD